MTNNFTTTNLARKTVYGGQMMPDNIKVVKQTRNNGGIDFDTEKVTNNTQNNFKTNPRKAS